MNNLELVLRSNEPAPPSRAIVAPATLEFPIILRHGAAAMRSTYSFANHHVFLGLMLLVAVIGCLSAFAQVDYATATLKGTVFDPQGAVISGATITATNPGTAVAKTTKSGGDGSYQILALPPGTYQVAIEAQGFSKEVVKGVVLSVGQSAVFDVHLKVGMTSEVIEVSGDTAALIQVEQTQQANTINSIQVEDLPNINRSFTQDVYTLPGVSSSEARSSLFGMAGTTGLEPAASAVTVSG